MANLTGGGQNQVLQTPWNDITTLRTPAAIPATGSLTFYTSQACMRDGNGNIIQCDDTVKGEFVGFFNNEFNQTVSSNESVYQNGILGDEMLNQIVQPHLFLAQMAAVAAGQEGQKVYWQFNNQVQFVTGVNGNLAGSVWQVFDSTHAWILPAWLNRGIGDFGWTSHMIVAPTVATLQLTKWDLSRVFELQSTVPLSITLPAVSLCSPGDAFQFVYTGGNASPVTVNVAAGNTISGITATGTVNGGTSVVIGTAQYSRLQIETDGISRWLVIGL